MNRNNCFILLILLLNSVIYLSCTKYSNDLAIIPPPTPPTPPIPPSPKTCIIAGFSQTNSGNKPEFFMSITYNSNLNPTKISVFDSAANSQLFYASLTYASADSIRIDAYQYFKLDNKNRVSRFITKQNIKKPTSSDNYVYEYTYNSEGYLTTKNLYVNGSLTPFYKTTYTYSNGLLTSCLMVAASADNKKILESTITYDESISPKTMFYTFADGFESNYFSPAMNFGIRPAKPPKQIITKFYDPANNKLLDTWTSNYSGYTIDGNGYLSYGVASGDQQQGLANFFGKTKFNYQCQ
jgi:hypothetical protein